MKPFKERNETQEEGWKPSLKEAKDLSEKLKLFSKKEVNGKMQYPFELYLEKENIISFGSRGEKQVRNPLAYHRLTETEALMKWHEEKEMENLFKAFPEEKELYEVKRKEWMMDIREMFDGMAKKTV